MCKVDLGGCLLVGFCSSNATANPTDTMCQMMRSAAKAQCVRGKIMKVHARPVKVAIRVQHNQECHSTPSLQDQAAANAKVRVARLGSNNQRRNPCRIDDEKAWESMDSCTRQRSGA